MTDISSELRRELTERAEAHYSDALPYHNWQHALDVMNSAADITSRSIASEIANKRNVLMVAAAWHDADYHLDGLGKLQTKEQRSAELVAVLLPELSAEDRELVVSGIIDTTVAKKPKDSLFGEVLHAADLGHFASTPAHFMQRLTLMREEWGFPSWEVTTDRTVSFGDTIIEEARELMPKVLSPEDAAAWVARIETNLAYLQDEFEEGRLQG